jgi:hypothetical protein
MLMVASSATGCVAAKNYDEARTVAESEARAHTRTRERLEAAMQRIHALEDALAQHEQKLEVDQNAAEESKLASTVATKEREAAFELVEQLRSELARTGDHLLLFAQEKRDLAQTLLVAEQRMGDIETAGKHLGELVATTRDLSLLLSSELEQGRVELVARDGQIVLGMKPEALFSPSSDTLTMEAGPVLSAVGKVSGQHPTLRVLLRESSGTSPSSRLQHLGDALRERGVADARLVLPATRSEQPASAPVVDQAAAPAGTSGADDSASGDAPNAGTGAQKAPAPPAGSPVAVAAAASPSAPTPARYEITFAL